MVCVKINSKPSSSIFTIIKLNNYLFYDDNTLHEIHFVGNSLSGYQ
jgi:hypothetical protein